MKALAGLVATAILLYALPIMAADTAAGKALYEKKCGTCHGAAGEGKESIAKMFQVEMKPLSSKDVQARTDSDIKKIVLEGAGKMKPVKDVQAKDADDVVAYLRTLAKK